MFDEEFPKYPPKPKRELTVLWLCLAAVAVVVFVSARIWA